MSTITAAGASGNAVVSPLVNDAADAALAPAGADPNSDAPSGDRGPATDVVLSDKVKSILARATADLDVADRLKAFVESQRADGDGNTSRGGDRSKTDRKKDDVNTAFRRLTAGNLTSDSSNDLGPVSAAHDFSNSVQFEGFTVGVAARAKDGSYRAELVGPDGLSFFDFRFGHSGEVTGFGGVKPGVVAASYQRGNVEYITVTENEAASLSATVSTDAGTVTTNAVAAHSSQITFAIDFTTGAIQATKSDALITSASAQITAAAPSVSRVA
jgi:hypothetical protein